MANGYQPELWRDVFVMLGTAAAALIGLLFIATSLHLEEIVKNQMYRIRARNNLFYLWIMLVQAALVLIPQPMAALGIELTVIVVFLLFLHIKNFYLFLYKNKEMGVRGGFQIYTTLRFITSDLLGLAGAAFLVALSNWGMYLITASYLIFIGSVIYSAWLIMLGVGQAETVRKAT